MLYFSFNGRRCAKNSYFDEYVVFYHINLDHANSPFPIKIRDEVDVRMRTKEVGQDREELKQIGKDYEDRGYNTPVQEVDG